MNLDHKNIQLKPQDKVAMAAIGVLVLVLIAIPVLTWFATVTALLATIAADTVYFFITAGALIFGISWLWTNRTAILYKWKNAARNLRRTIAREDPIGVMDTAIARFGAKLTEIDGHVVKAEAARKQQVEAIKTMRSKATKEQDLADAANRAGKSDAEVARYAAAADRWNASADKLEPIAAQLKNVQEKMQQARELCYTRLEDMKNQRDVFKLEYDTMMAGQKAIKGFKKFFGTNEDLEMLQLSIEQVDEQTAVAEAEIDQFLNDLKPGLDKQNLEKDAAQQKALERMRPAMKQLPASTGSLGLASIVKEAELVEVKK